MLFQKGLSESAHQLGLCANKRCKYFPFPGFCLERWKGVQDKREEILAASFFLFFFYDSAEWKVLEKRVFLDNMLPSPVKLNKRSVHSESNCVTNCPREQMKMFHLDST